MRVYVQVRPVKIVKAAVIVGLVVLCMAHPVLLWVVGAVLVLGLVTRRLNARPVPKLPDPEDSEPYVREFARYRAVRDALERAERSPEHVECEVLRPGPPQS
jgi:hypothetical protein